MTTVQINEQTRKAEIEAIRQVVSTVERAQNNERPDEFVSLFRADAIWTTGHGKRLFGREAISAFTRQVLPGGMRDTSVTFDIEHVLFIRPDVVAVKVRQVYQTPDGQDVGTPMFVMAKEDGQWRLTACQNTSVLNDE
ncbi:SgcJ/EcaC family oxidoreductase [Micromonospora sp. LH3U1]|uniref:SgcJ/EcaC family oxidoreductase n=1 Tax=Micromonospora sp. LH3U1 TaxID=3018339 RepID=UPI00234BE7BD|nr:SgcJ/EcaC family oxidoreductase [Micromonospora sp. LH3U1]WCN79568.1 SgcJ/EcaC family oxidoreductase [Micromonospora sp. LH3U1]